MTSQVLIVLSGLPGSGKSTVAEGLSRALSMPAFSVDPIEAAMWRNGLARDQTGIAAYEVAITLAGENLRLGHSVIVDAVMGPIVVISEILDTGHARNPHRRH